MENLGQMGIPWKTNGATRPNIVVDEDLVSYLWAINGILVKYGNFSMASGWDIPELNLWIL